MKIFVDEDDTLNLFLKIPSADMFNHPYYTYYKHFIHEIPEELFNEYQKIDKELFECEEKIRKIIQKNKKKINEDL